MTCNGSGIVHKVREEAVGKVVSHADCPGCHKCKPCKECGGVISGPYKFYRNGKLTYSMHCGSCKGTGGKGGR